MSQSYHKDDYVIVYLSNADADFRICKVVAVGENDLMCEIGGSYKKLFRVSKQRCVKFENRKMQHTQYHPTEPKIGDLVVSIKDSFGKDRETFTGIVKNIIYDPVSNDRPVYVIRTGQKVRKAHLENIIVLEFSS